MGMTNDQILQQAEQAVQDAILYISGPWNMAVDSTMQCVNTQPGQSTSMQTPQAYGVKAVYDNMTLTLTTFIHQVEFAVNTGEYKLPFIFHIFSLFDIFSSSIRLSLFEIRMSLFDSVWMLKYCLCNFYLFVVWLIFLSSLRLIISYCY